MLFIFFIAELQQNCVNAVQSVTKSLASGDVYYRLTDGDMFVSSHCVIGAQSTDTVEKISKHIEKKNSEDDLPGRKRKSKDADAEQVRSFSRTYFPWELLILSLMIRKNMVFL